MQVFGSEPQIDQTKHTYWYVRFEFVVCIRFDLYSAIEIRRLIGSNRSSKNYVSNSRDPRIAVQCTDLHERVGLNVSWRKF